MQYDNKGPSFVWVLIPISILLVIVSTAVGLAKQKQDTFATFKIEQPKNRKWIAFHKKNFKRKKGDEAKISAKYSALSQLNVEQVQPIDGVNGFSFVAKADADYSKLSDGEWVIQPVNYYHISETLYRLTPVEVPAQPTCPTDPGPNPQPGIPIANPTWGQRAMHVSSLTDASTILVEDIDTGLDRSVHDQFPAGMLVPGVSKVQGQAWDVDGNGHGTHTAGTIGSTKYGHAKVKIKPCKGLNNQGGGDSLSLGGCVNDAQASRAHIVSASWGMDTGTDQYIGAQIDSYVSAGGIFVAAAGNASGRPIGYPSSKPNVWTVTSMDEQFNLSVFSSKGIKSGGKMGIAPGSNVCSLWPVPLGGPEKCISGTSMATPAASATMAIMLLKKKTTPGFINRNLAPDQQGMGQFDVAETLK